MIKRTIDIDGRWKVIVYYNVDYNLFNIIEQTLIDLNCSDETIYYIRVNMEHHRAKAVTINNNTIHKSIVLFNKHRTKRDYANSVVHEAEHIKQSILDVYNIQDKGEVSAYTVGYIASKMLMPIIKLL